MNEIKLPNQLSPATPDSDLQGDNKHHPIPVPVSPDSALGTPSNVELHESDSIDRRMIRALTHDRLQNLENNADYFKSKKTMSIIVTNASV
eukprot:UN03508